MIFGQNRKKILLSISCLVIFWIFFNFKLTEVPPGINGDEASIGYNAILLSRTLHDENKRLLPLFVLTMDGKDWKQPVTVYSTALFFRLFEPSYNLLRQVSILYVLISAGLLFFLVKEILNIKSALIGVLIFLTTPIIMIQSHLALENIAPLPFVIFWLLMLAKYGKKKKNLYLLYGGISLGISFYSYNSMRLIMPVFFLLTIIYILYLDNFSIKKSIYPLRFLIIGVLPFIGILPLAMNKYPGAIFGNNQLAAFSSYQDFILPYLSAFDPSFLFIQGDSTPYHSTGKHGIYLLMTLPLFLLGSFGVMQKKNPILILALVSFFLSPILFGVAGSVPHRGSRLVALVPFYTLITVFGISILFQLNNHRRKIIVLSFVIMLSLLNYFDFLHNYWFEYPIRVKEHFSTPLHIAFKKLYQNSKNNHLTPFIEAGIYNQEKATTRFFEQVYFPTDLKKWQTPEVPRQSILLVRTADARNLEKQGFERLDIGIPDDYYLVVAK